MNDNKLIKKIFEMGGNNFSTIIAIFFTLQIANFLSAYLFKKSYFAPGVATFALIFLSFALLKDLADEKKKKFGFKILKFSMVLFAVTLINHGMLSVASGFSSEIKRDSFFRLSYLLNIMVVTSSIALFRKEGFKKNLENVYSNSILAKLNIGLGNKDSARAGDVQLCVDKETKAPVMLLAKDRYLHMLILGPTGCGKTSQIIIPMINQDMQNPACGITVIEPKTDLAEKVYAMAQYYNRPAVYFNPILPNCPYFNPLFGREDEVIENMATTFKMLNPDSPQFFLDMNENLIRNSLKVLKRLFGNKATLIELGRLIQNSGGVGRKMVQQFSRLNSKTEAIAKENADIASWFLNDYFNEKSKTYEHCSGLRSQVAKIISNKYLRRVLNPPDGLNDVDFDKHLAEGGVVAITTAQGALRDLGRFLGYFIILQFQSAVFKRPGDEDTRRAHFLYIDEFQEYSNPGFAQMLTQGRSYRVASHLATQNRALMAMGGGRDGKNFVELVSTNARNVVIFPGGNAVDAKYYSDQFGEVLRKKVQKGISRAKFNPLYGIQKMSYPNESIRESEELEARFSPSDIIFREFGEITYCIIKNNTIQQPSVGLVNWIPKELNDKLNAMIKENECKEIDEEDENYSSEASSSTATDDNVVKDPIATMGKPVISGTVPIQTLKPKVVAKPETIEDLPEDDSIDYFETEVKSIPSNPFKEQPEEAYNNDRGSSSFDFMSEDEDELI